MGDDDDEGFGALEQLYRSGYQRFFRLAFAVTGSREGAADAVQEAFVRAIRSRSTLREPGALEGWVWRTVLNAALTQRSTRVRAAEVGQPFVPELPADESAEWPELRALVAALPERQRSVLFLRHYADLDYEQIAVVLGIARGTVAATLTHAHAALRKTVEVPR
jgi:RNA polymerase sigma-70 factor (ECF subfamily)